MEVAMTTHLNTYLVVMALAAYPFGVLLGMLLG